MPSILLIIVLQIKNAFKTFEIWILAMFVLTERDREISIFWGNNSYRVWPNPHFALVFFLICFLFFY